MTTPPLEDRPRGVLPAIVARFLSGYNSLLLLLAALALGVAAVMVTAREEEPQIVVPLADVFVEVPGYSAAEVERLVATPLERILWQLDGVEYVYSTSMRDRAVVTVRFYVGEDREDSIIKLRNRIESNLDLVPDIVRSWLVRPVEIDDVPVVLLALHGEGYDGFELRRIGEELKARLDALPELSRTEIVGGMPREIRVEVDRDRLQGRDLTLLEVHEALRRQGVVAMAGAFQRLDRDFVVAAGSGYRSVEELREVVVALRDGLPVRLRDVAEVLDGPGEPTSYTRITFGAASGDRLGTSRPAVVLALAKQKGTDAWRVARRVIAEAERLRQEVLPTGVELTVVRNYGATANEKVNELLESIAFALITVVGLLLVFLGWREALVVALAVPVSFSLALFVNLLLGYTINRVTLFALILSLGLVVDDPITNVDNIQRHIRRRACGARKAVLQAVQEVLPPVIMSTLTIIVSFLPMFFITGMMGPYMEPMAANVPLAVAFSTVAALTIVPWLAWRLLRHMGVPDEDESGACPVPVEEHDPTSPFLRRLYRRMVAPWIACRWRAWSLLGIVLVLLVGASSLAVFGKVPLKMLPYDNKNELQVVLDLPEGSTLEHTDAVVRDFERYLAAQPEVVDLESYVGVPSPMDFNGMVRHAYLRHGPHLADIRINLLHKDDRELQSHAIALRMRRDLEAIARRHGVAMKLVEVPPGPPVLSTIVAEVYGSEDTPYAELVTAAGEVRQRMAREPGMGDLDVMATDPHERVDFALDRQQAALHGVDEAQVAALLGLALHGGSPALLRDARERQPLAIQLLLPRPQRTGLDQLGLLTARTREGSLVALDEIGEFRRVPADRSIYHKNLRPVVYVLGEISGRPPVEAILSLQRSLREEPLPPGIRVDWNGEGEWHITLRVFRDLGIAFGAALLAIYILLIMETGSLALPLLVMLAIPLTAIGIMPGFWLLNVLMAREVGGFQDSVFFTATAMIGMIALGGIVVRNSLVLIEFIKNAVAEGASLREAIYESGAVRMRPILLTAGTTALGAWPITLDPIFSGLAWALIFGLFASTLFTLVVVPAAFFLLFQRKYEHAQAAR